MAMHSNSTLYNGTNITPGRIPDIYDIIPSQDSNVEIPDTNNSIPNLVEFEKPLQQTSTINASEILVRNHFYIFAETLL